MVPCVVAMHEHPEQESIDIRKLQRVLSGNHIESPILVACSPPVPRSQIQIPATPTRLPRSGTQLSDPHHGGHDSHDHTGNFRFFNNSVAYSQGDLGDTQVDPAYLQDIAIPLNTNVAGDSQLEDTQPTLTPPRLHGEVIEEEDLLATQHEASIPLFPEAKRFGCPTEVGSSPEKLRSEGHNPLAQFGIGGGTGDFSLTQAFNATSSPLRSSPERPRTGSSSQFPITPSFPARIMAKSMPRIFEESPCIQDSPSMPKCTSEPPELPGTRSKSPEDGDIRSTPARSTLQKISQASRHTPRARSLSPVFSSPPIQRNPTQRRRPITIAESDDDDCFALTKSQELREKAEQKRKKGVEQLRKFVRKPQSEADLKKIMETPRKPTIDKERRKSGKQNIEIPRSDRKRLKTAPPEEIMSETEDESIPLSLPPPPEQRKTPPAREATPQVLASDPIQPPKKSTSPVPKETPKQADIDEEWERVHSFPRPPVLKRRAKSISCLRNEVPHEPEITKAKTVLAEPTQSPATVKRGSSAMPASLKDMAPFNIPLSPPLTTDRRQPTQTSPQKKMPEFVRESSNLIPLSQHQSLTPHATSSANASPSRKDTQETNTRGSDVPKTPFPAQRLTTLRMRNGNTTIPETSPWDKGGMISPMTVAPPVTGLGNIRETDEATPVRKRKHKSGEQVEKSMLPPVGAETAPSLRTFESLENAAPPLSSREEPDEVDMIDIMREVGAGDQPDLELPEPSDRRPTKRRKQSVEKQPGATVTEYNDKQTNAVEMGSPALPVLPRSEPPPKRKALGKRVRGKLSNVANTVASVGKPLARKVAKSTAKKSQARQSISLLTKPETTQVTPTPAIHNVEENISSDILSTTNPVFHISVPKAADPSKRVFALFKDAKLQYHPATVMYSESPTTLRVCFDDGTEDLLERHQVRSLDLRPGDVIRVDLPNMRKGNWVIKSFQDAPVRNSSDGAELVTPVYEGYTAKLTDTQGRYYIYVEPKKKGQDGISSVQVSITKIYLTKALWAQFASRNTYSPTLQIPISAVSFQMASPSFSNSSITSGVTPGVTPSMSVRRTQTPAFMTSNKNSPVTRNSLFAAMVFCLSFGEKEMEKRTVTDRIKANGGKILESGFDELFVEVDTASTSASDRRASMSREPSVAPSETATFTLKTEGHRVGFAAVIADRHSRRTKFLQALALGLPCIAYKWIEDCVKKGCVMDWRPYLLPAGESAYLNGAVHSRILDPFDASSVRLPEIFENRVRPMARWNVLFVTKLVIEKRKAFTFLVHALGADSVTKVKNLEAAAKLVTNSKDMAQEQPFDLILTSAVDRDRAVKMWRARVVRGLRVMDEEQLVQSLILGSLVVDL